MSKWLPALIVSVMIAFLGWSSYHYYGKVSGLEKENASLSRQVKSEQAKYQGLIEEYNALKDYQSEGEAKKTKSKEATDVAIKDHNRNGSFVRASQYDARLLKQRSLEVRGEATDTGKLTN